MADAAPTSSISSLSTEECWRHLGAERVGRLVVMVGSQPDIFPVNYLVDEGEIVVRTAEGTKLAAAIMGGNVAFEIDEFDEATHTGWSVVVHGTAHESKTLADAMHDDEIDPEPWATGIKTRTIHITPTEVTGRVLQPEDPDTPEAVQ